MKDEWRIHMVPIESVFWKIQPVVEIRLKCSSNVLDIPDDTSKVLVLEIISNESHSKIVVIVKFVCLCPTYVQNSIPKNSRMCRSSQRSKN